MSIELVGLAFDEKMTDRLWADVPVERAFEMVLEDEFRRKVDLRSLLYHKGALDLLSELEHFLRQGGESRTMVELMAARFKAGIEDFPSPSGEFSFDFKLIRQFASLAMVEDFVLADSCLKAILRRVGFLKNGAGAGWSLVETRDYIGVTRALRELRLKDLLDISEQFTEKPGPKFSIERLVGNYIEFLSYASNNGLTPFFYNSESDFRRWGNLAERKNRRGERVVDLSLRRRGKAGGAKDATKEPKKTVLERGLEQKLKLKREVDWLLTGLKDSDPLIRQKSAESLGRLGNPDTFTHLTEALRDEEPEVRQEIVRAIGATSGSRAEDVLLKAVESDEVFSVQLTAAHVLRKMNSKALIPVLLEGIEKGKPHFATLLAFHPGLKSHQAAQLHLTALALSEDPHVRRQAAFVLQKLPTRDSRDVLLKLTDDDDEETRVHALYSLWSLHHPSVAAIAQKMQGHYSEATVRAGTIVSAWASTPRK